MPSMKFEKADEYNRLRASVAFIFEMEVFIQEQSDCCFEIRIVAAGHVLNCLAISVDFLRMNLLRDDASYDVVLSRHRLLTLFTILIASCNGPDGPVRDVVLGYFPKQRGSPLDPEV